MPVYGEHVDRAVMEKGRQHPLVKMQCFCEEIEVQWKMFNEMRPGMMTGLGGTAGAGDGAYVCVLCGCGGGGGGVHNRGTSTFAAVDGFGQPVMTRRRTRQYDAVDRGDRHKPI